MSSNTLMRIEPPPELVVTTVEGSQVKSMTKVFGPEGCLLFRGTLEDLCLTNSRIIADLTRHIADEAERQAEVARLLRHLKWQRTAEGAYTSTIEGDQIPEAAARVGVTEVRMQLYVGGSTLETRFEQSVRGRSRLAPEQQQMVQTALQRAVNLRVNHVLAVGLQQQVSQKLRQKLSVEHQPSLRNEVSPQNVYQTMAVARVSAI